MTDLKTLPPSPTISQKKQIIFTESAGKDSNIVYQESVLAHLALRPPSSAPTGKADIPKSLPERLFDSRANCKIRMASVAMHIDKDWRNGFFKQVDNLLNLEDWDEDDEPVTAASFATLIRMILFIKPERRPGLGAAEEGYIIAAWTVGDDRLTIKCLPNDQIQWVLVHCIDGDREVASGQTTLPRLTDVLQPYDSKKYWCANEVPGTSA